SATTRSSGMTAPLASSVARQYVLLPRHGVFASSGPALATLTELPYARSTEGAMQATFDFAPAADLRVIDTVAETGPKLVELDDAAAAAVNDPSSPVRALPVIEYGRPDEPTRPLAGGTAAPAAVPVDVRCVDAKTSSPVSDVHVV